MALHLSARVAWHMNGWDGRICRDPASNTYCVGPASYPLGFISEARDLDWEQANAGRCCMELGRMPPCMYSVNAFGPHELSAHADPPDCFGKGSRRRSWTLPASTVCLWPYDEMYNAEGVRNGDGFDYDQRLERAREFWSRIEPDRSLIVYYANHSNPFSEEDARRYVIVGISRVKAVGEIMFYEGCSESVRQKYGGGFVWQLPVTSHYPDQGFRLPYHLYLDQPDLLARFLCVPENARNFKYASRQFSDDEALVLVEQLLEKAAALRDLGDESEDWSVRIAWMQSLIAELWMARGLYPGVTRVLDHLAFRSAIAPFKAQVELGRERKARDELFAFLDGHLDTIPWLEIAPDEGKRLIRRWNLKSLEERQLLRDLLPRFDLRTDQIERILGSERTANGLEASLPELCENPYLLAEQFVGDAPDDTIPFSKIDHGFYPSPELAGEPLGDLDDWRRLRALCVDRLACEARHTFLPASMVIHDVNHRLSLLPEWKRHQFTERYLDVDADELGKALTIREIDGQKQIYLRKVFDDERLVETVIRSLAERPDIPSPSALTPEHWRRFLFEPGSVLAARNPEEYREAIESQARVCQHVFARPVSIVSGTAGTGKTTVIRALIEAIGMAHGSGTSFQLLAPTGKAADCIRERVGKDAMTIHAFLARRSWLNKNLTFRRSGGAREESKTTYIVDESSMLDLELVAALFRAINFQAVQRLIFVGDPNQLPPIGRGRFFSELIDWMRRERTDSIGTLELNVRHMENRLTGRGTGILDLASLYIHPDASGTDDEARFRAEEILGRVQEGGEVAPDLRVVYWGGPDDLASKLLDTIVADMERDTGQTLDPEHPYKLWRAAFDGHPEAYQILSPYRVEQSGTENLNVILQRAFRGRPVEHGRHLGGIALFDKVIQVVNRPGSNPIPAYGLKSRRQEKMEIFNGELGFTKPHGLDGDRWRWPGFLIRRFQVVFSRRRDYWVDYTGEGEVAANLELAYAISVHKSQGSEFGRVYFVLPKYRTRLLSRELFYTGITRATRHCTLLVEEDVSPLLDMRRPECSALLGIHSSLFDLPFRQDPDDFLIPGQWYEERKVHRTVNGILVRTKSELIIANLLAGQGIPFGYEVPLRAADGTFYLPDFTIVARGETWYWEHVGRLDSDAYRNHWETKQAWYDRFFPGRLIVTHETGDLSQEVHRIIKQSFA